MMFFYAICFDAQINNFSIFQEIKYLVRSDKMNYPKKIYSLLLNEKIGIKIETVLILRYKNLKYFRRKY